MGPPGVGPQAARRVPPGIHGYLDQRHAPGHAVPLQDLLDLTEGRGGDRAHLRAQGQGRSKHHVLAPQGGKAGLVSAGVHQGDARDRPVEQGSREIGARRPRGAGSAATRGRHNRDQKDAYQKRRSPLGPGVGCQGPQRIGTPGLRPLINPVPQEQGPASGGCRTCRGSGLERAAGGPDRERQQQRGGDAGGRHGDERGPEARGVGGPQDHDGGDGSPDVS